MTLILWWISTKVFISNNYFCTSDKILLPSFLSNIKQQEWTGLPVLPIHSTNEWTKDPQTSHNSTLAFYFLPGKKQASFFFLSLHYSFLKQINNSVWVCTYYQCKFIETEIHTYILQSVCVCKLKILWYSNFRMLNIVSITLFLYF